MAWLNWFSKKEPENYEGVLAALDLDIQKRRSRLSEIRLRERRTSMVLTLYACGIWVAYVATWYTGVLQRHIASLRFGEAIVATSVFLGPFAIQFARRIVQWWFARIEDAEEKTLKELLSQQRSKLEEIRKKTNFNSIKNILDRYDYPTSQRPFTSNGMPSQQPNQMMQRRAEQKPAQVNGTAAPTSVPTAMASNIAGSMIPMVPPRKRWYDKVADVLLGDDDSGANRPASRYALICQKCFAHNGLVPPSLYEVSQYVCPKCGHFNASLHNASGSVNTSTSASSIGASNTSGDLSSPSLTSLSTRPLNPVTLAVDPNTRHLQDAFAAAKAGKVIDPRKSVPAANTPSLSDVNTAKLEKELMRMQYMAAEPAEIFDNEDSGGGSAEIGVKNASRPRSSMSEVEGLVEMLMGSIDGDASGLQREKIDRAG